MAWCGIAALTALGIFPTPSPAAVGPPANAASIRALADSLANVALNQADGQGLIFDPVGRNAVGYYGPAGFGYAGLRAAARSGDQALLENALRAAMVSVIGAHGEPFDAWLTGKTYLWASKVLARDPRWTTIAGPVAAYLKAPPSTGAHGRPLSPGWTSRRRYNNWKLVELAADAIGNAAALPLIAGPAKQSRDPLIATLASAAVAPPATTSWVPETVRALSDPGGHPPAYSVFSAMLLAEVGREDPALLTPSLRRAARALGSYVVTIASPSGTVAWHARSMHLSWTLAAAMIVGIERGDRDGLGLANAAWRQLRQRYPQRTDGWLPIAPVLADSDDARGIDSYANTVIYGGLTATLLNVAADTLERRGLTLAGSSPAGARNGDLRDGHGAGLLAQRRGGVWWGASVRRSSGDLRYQAGLQAVQVRTSGGAWTDVLPARPKLFGSLAAPIWPAANGCSWSWRAQDAGHVLGCGSSRLRIAVDGPARRVVLTVQAQPSRRLTGALYVRAPRLGAPHELGWDGGSMTTSAPMTVTVSPQLWTSATSTGLQQVRYNVVTDQRGRAAFSFGL